MTPLPVIPGSLPILPRRHEKFARMVALGASAAMAYKTHVSAKVENESLWIAASRLTKLAKVALRVQFLRSQAGKVALKNFGIDAETLIAAHMEILSTPIAQIDETHPLCEKMKRSRRVAGAGEEKTVWEVEEVAKPSVSRSLEALANLIGANAPSKSEVNSQVQCVVRPIAETLSGPGTRAAVIRALVALPEGREEMRAALQEFEATLLPG